jgi:hypothetical protein
MLLFKKRKVIWRSNSVSIIINALLNKVERKTFLGQSLE